MLVTGLLVGVVFGFVLQRGRFCVTGMLRDIFMNKTWRGFTALMILISVHSIGLTLFISMGVITPEFKNFAPLAVVVGGFIFGLGIILAGGCASGTWYRSAEGLVGSWIALLFYGLSAAAMKSGPLAGFNDWMKVWNLPLTTIHGALGISPWILVALVCVITFFLARHYLQKDAGRAHYDFGRPWYAKPMNQYVAAILVGIIGTVAFLASNAAGRNGGLSITTPTADLVRWSATGDGDYFNWGLLLVLGLFVGAFVAAQMAGEFRVRVPDAQTASRAVWGGIMMGVGASLAGGCTVGNGMVQTSLFSFQGWVSLLFIALGVGAGAKWWLRPSRPAAKNEPAPGKDNSTYNGATMDRDEAATEDAVLVTADRGEKAPAVGNFAAAQGVVTLKSRPEPKQRTRPLGNGRYFLDQMGAVCPFPLIEAKQAMAELAPGEALVIDFDCTQATDSIPTWAADEGHEVTDMHQSGDAGWQITVVKGE